MALYYQETFFKNVSFWLSNFTNRNLSIQNRNSRLRFMYKDVHHNVHLQKWKKRKTILNIYLERLLNKLWDIHRYHCMYTY